MFIPNAGPLKIWLRSRSHHSISIPSSRAVHRKITSARRKTSRSFIFLNCSFIYRNEYPVIKERNGSAEMPDVLLTLKHPLAHSGQMSPSAFACGGSSQCQAPSASLSYTVHPQVFYCLYTLQFWFNLW